jgi:hypothetical protein
VTNHGDQGLSERAVRTVIVIEFVVIDDDGHVRTADQFGILVAARNLNRTVSSNSYSISQLEAQRGFPARRTPERSKLTERGRALFGEAKAAVERRGSNVILPKSECAGRA